MYSTMKTFAVSIFIHFIHNVLSSKHVFSVSSIPIRAFFQRGEIQEMRRSMHFVVKLLGIRQSHLVFHRRLMSHAHEIVIPGTLARYHKKSQKSVTQKHLNFLVMAWQVPLGIVPFVRVILAPLESRGGQFVSSKRAGTGGKRTGNNDGLFSVPSAMFRHDFGVSANILGRQLGQFVRLSMNPSQRFQIFEVLMLG